MRTRSTSTRRLVGSLMVGGALFLVIPARDAAAQATSTLVLRSGLHSYYQGRVARVVVTEVGLRAGAPRVRIDLRDAAGQVVARTEGILGQAEPVGLDFPVPREIQLRATVTITTQGRESTTPITVLEDLEPTSFTVEQRGVCAAGPPSGREGPQTVANCGCPGWVASSFTTIP